MRRRIVEALILCCWGVLMAAVLSLLAIGMTIGFFWIFAGIVGGAS